MKAAIQLPYEEEKINRLKVFFQGTKKTVIGILVYCGLEILFIGIAGGMIWLILHTVSEALNHYNKHSDVFNDSSFRWVVSGYAGVRNRKRVKGYLERKFKIILN